MNKYKLVPVEPTDDMATAAMNAETTANMLYGEPAAFSDIWNAMLAAAPAVQGEPVAFASFADMELCMHRPAGGEWTPVYTAPQPAEQQPSPDVAGLVEALEAVEFYHEEVEDNDGNLMMHYSKMMRKVHEALAAHRKGGSDNE